MAFGGMRQAACVFLEREREGLIELRGEGEKAYVSHYYTQGQELPVLDDPWNILRGERSRSSLRSSPRLAQWVDPDEGAYSEGQAGEAGARQRGFLWFALVSVVKGRCVRVSSALDE